MSYKDSLTLYNELKSQGISEDQAQIHAAQLGGVSDLVKESNQDMRIIHKEIENLYRTLLWGFTISYAALGYLVFIK